MSVDIRNLKALAEAAKHNQYDYLALNDYGTAMPPAVTLELIAEIERHRQVNAEGCKPDISIISSDNVDQQGLHDYLQRVGEANVNYARHHLDLLAQRAERDALLEEALDAAASIGMHDLVDRINTSLAANTNQILPSRAVSEVLTERLSQKDVEGYSAERDDQYVNGELATAAAAYAFWASLSGLLPPDRTLDPPCTWPWEPDHWKPTTQRQMLIKAGALILAELERLERMRAIEVQP